MFAQRRDAGCWVKPAASNHRMSVALPAGVAGNALCWRAGEIAHRALISVLMVALTATLISGCASTEPKSTSLPDPVDMAIASPALIASSDKQSSLVTEPAKPIDLIGPTELVKSTPAPPRTVPLAAPVAGSLMSKLPSTVAPLPVPLSPPISSALQTKPAAKPAAVPAAPARSAPPLDLKSLEARLKATPGIGLFTKLALKNQIDDLLDQFRAHYGGQRKATLAELRQAYDRLLLKVLALLQDSDPPLARAIASSRESIWDILSNPAKFAAV